jgi:pyruvate dehydrogenase E2 component (dihydrolipoamide acetyltransferase)
VASLKDVRLPDIGDFSGVEIIEILVAPGDRIEPEQSLLTLESDKATMEIPAPFGGLVNEVRVAVGDKVSEGDLLFRVEAREGAATASAAAAEPSETAAPQAQSAPPRSGPPERKTRPDETLEVRLPDIGDFSDVPVIEILVAPGDQVTRDQSLLTLESDKATMEIPSPYGGEVQRVHVKLGDKVNKGDLLLTLRRTGDATRTESDASGPSLPGTPAAESPTPSETQPPARMPGEKERRQAPILPRPADMVAIARGRTPHASPGVRRFARELGVDLARVKGSGPKGRVLREDVQQFVKQTLTQGAPAPAAGVPFAFPPAPEVDFAKFGPVRTEPLSRIKRLSGAHLHRCWVGIPHVTQLDEADITELEAFRRDQKTSAEQQGVKLTFLPFLMKAVARALEEMPNLKASLTPDGESLVLKDYTHIGVAVDTPNGLVVPVLRDVDKKGLLDLARELADLSGKARAGKLLPGDMQGGCFSISSLGGIGGTAFTPIVNAPEVAILGVSRSETRPVWDGKAFVPRLMLPLALSYDHRVVDGAEGARFTTLLRGLLGDIRRLLL